MPTKTFDLYWSPEGRKIATVRATTERAAIRKAPKPYRKYLGEIYAEEVSVKNKFVESATIQIADCANNVYRSLSRHV